MYGLVERSSDDQDGTGNRVYNVPLIQFDPILMQNDGSSGEAMCLSSPDESYQSIKLVDGKGVRNDSTMSIGPSSSSCTDRQSWTNGVTTLGNGTRQRTDEVDVITLSSDEDEDSDSADDLSTLNGVGAQTRRIHLNEIESKDKMETSLDDLNGTRDDDVDGCEQQADAQMHLSTANWTTEQSASKSNSSVTTVTNSPASLDDDEDDNIFEQFDDIIRKAEESQLKVDRRVAEIFSTGCLRLASETKEQTRDTNRGVEVDTQLEVDQPSEMDAEEGFCHLTNDGKNIEQANVDTMDSNGSDQVSNNVTSLNPVADNQSLVSSNVSNIKESLDSQSPGTSKGSDIGDQHPFGTEDYGAYYRIKTNNICEHCNVTFDDKINLLVHDGCYYHKNSVKALECTFCGRTCSNFGMLKIHLEQHVGMKFICKTCSKKFTSKSSVSRHVNGCGKSKGGPRKGLLNISGGRKSVNYRASGKALGKPRIKNANKRTELAPSSLKFKCTKCSKAYKSWPGLNHHIDSDHTDVKDKTVPCKHGQCSELFSNRTAMHSHCFYSHGQPKHIRNYRCNICTKVFSEQFLLDLHGDLIHSDAKDKSVACTFTECTKMFLTMANMNLHLELQHN